MTPLTARFIANLCLPLALHAVACVALMGQPLESAATANLQQRVDALEQENISLREEIKALKKIKSEWFQWRYGLTAPEQVEQSELRREAWDRVDETIRLLGVAPGSRVADIGAGHGFFSVRLAPVVGEAGRVYAVEVDPVLVGRLRQRAIDAGIANLEVVSASAENPNLPAGALDAILLADVYHELSEPDDVVGHLYDALKPGGTLVVIDYFPNHPDGLSRAEQSLDHAISPDLVADDLRKSRFRIERTIDPFVTDHPAGLRVYAVVARRE